MPKRLLLFFLLALTMVTCRKDDDRINTDPSARLIFSENLILFDTIFTTVGSTTHRLRVYNPGNETVVLSSISIRSENGSKAYYRMNVDGYSGNQVTNIEILGKDSLFVFVDVIINPNDDNLPFLVEGTLEFVLNGNIQNVKILAYGQNAIFITPNHFPGNIPDYSIVGNGEAEVTWTKDLPIVIYGYAVVDEDQHLTIKEGTQIYLHANAGLWVFQNGQLTVKGTLEEPVVFQGDRLDDYKGIAGSWDRIWINEGREDQINSIENAIIKDAFIGIQVEYDPFVGRKEVSENYLLLENTVIDNCKANGIYALGYRISGTNVIVQNCGSACFYASGRGGYFFNNCTFANYWRGESRSDPAVYLTNYYYDFDAEVLINDSMLVEFHNCIIYGDQESEFNIESDLDPGDNINFLMNHTLLKTNVDVTKYGRYKIPVINPENKTLFINPVGGDYHHANGSPALDVSDPEINFPDSDIEGKMRSAPPFDLGAYEF